MKILICFLLIVWIYLITVFTRAKLYFFKFVAGSVGLFFFMMVILQPYLVNVLSRSVAAASGIMGDVTGCYQAFYQYSLILIQSGGSAISMYIDYECSGVIEILAFTALLWFFPLYNTLEKIMYNIIGVVWIFLANIIRIFIICVLVYYYGNNIFYFAHTIFGRIVFYALSIILYFYVFTRSQIKRQKVGNVLYGDDIK
ncbi:MULTISPECIES: exosortase family protein XrtG [Clostridium]|uniref:Transmembrane exosortase n=2 Tax=Clostridium TaxID=1485 RepID=A0A170NPM7_9CLOT|nr:MULTISPECIES: exosortase family protein XrtG [Clostridium]ADK13481.1 putative membrane protein [Clostridium ljungdahlii DSM 13528]OAA89100.1 Transmembrane exosortase (Exosortase_EpsH) [Clostridium ljungdahlii DSM 13528]OAA94280.1 Transmembrane exosortase (Exosortase_EpsH) [Clostridium coskatii]OBR95664.1 transmembrane exosortase [Clostridium coskatii]